MSAFGRALGELTSLSVRNFAKRSSKKKALRDEYSLSDFISPYCLPRWPWST